MRLRQRHLYIDFWTIFGCLLVNFSEYLKKIDQITPKNFQISNPFVKYLHPLGQTCNTIYI